MPASFIYKPGTYKGPVFLAPNETDRGSPPVIRTADGKEYVGKYLNTNEGRHQFVFPREIIGLSDLTVEYGGQTGQISSGAQSFEGAGITDWDARAKGSIGAGGGAGGFAPTTDSTGFGFAPAYLGDQFPSPVLTNYDPIETAPYNFTDVMDFTKQYAPFVRDQLALNNEQAKEFAYSALDTELKSLAEFVPQQAELKRRETNLDNFFNQEQRLQQVERGIPGARQDLEAQRGRANTYASGQLPDEQADRGLELGVRSNAADLASAGGFGASSSVARKASDLMSATQRFQVAQYGEGLLGQNVNQRASLLLAPTSYSNAGQQINVNPSVSPAQLQVQARNEITAQAGVSAPQALSTTVQQNQFTTGLEQQSRTFNASNTLQNDQFNAGNQNNFALQKFGYDVSYAGAVAGAAQTGSNTQIQLEQQKLAQQIFQDHQEQAQKNQQIGSILTGLTTILAGIGGGGGSGIGGALSGIISQIQDLFTGDSSSAVDAVSGAGQSVVDVANNPGPDFAGDDSVGGDSSDSADDASDVSNTPGAGESGDAGSGSGDAPQELGPDFGDSVGEGEVEPPQPDSGFEEFSLGRKAAYNTGSKAYDNRLTNFTNDIGVRVSPQATKRVGKDASSVLRGAGVSYTPGPNSQRAGVDFQGRQLYVDKTIARSTDTTVGDKIVQTFKSVFDPMNVFSKEDSTTLSKIGTVASNAAFLGNLTILAQQKNKKAFVNAILGAFQKPLLENFGKDPKDAGSISAAFTAYNLFQNWDSMSPTSKSLAIARLGMQAYQGATGVNLGKTVIPGTGVNGTPALTVGNALGLFATGYNVYGLVKNWDQYSDLQKLTGGIQTVANIANTAKNLGLLGSGTGNTVSGGSALAGGGSASGSAGAGGAAASEGIGLLGGAAAAAGIVAGAYTVYQGWGEGGSKGAVNGALGGAAIATGMYALGATNPYVLAGVVALSIASNTIKIGKHEDQVQRDGMRGLLKKNGLADDDYNITLADGSKFDIGVDGSGGYHEARNPDQMVGDRKGKKLSAYDLDYTNDLDYASGMSGIALSRLLAGGKAKNIDQLGNQLGNAGLGNVGYGKDMTRENFSKIMANQRSMYAKAGITSKEAAYALTNQAFKEGRINDSDAVAMQQAFNMMYDTDGYDTAQKLMGGRHKGIQVAEQSSQTVTATRPTGDSGFPAGNKPFNPRDPSTYPAGQSSNAGDPGFSKPFPPGVGPQYPNRPGTGVTDNGNRPGSDFPPGLARSFATRPGTGVTDNGNRPAAASPTGSSAGLTTKEEMRKRNSRRYAVNQEYAE